MFHILWGNLPPLFGQAFVSVRFCFRMRWVVSSRNTESQQSLSLMQLNKIPFEGHIIFFCVDIMLSSADNEDGFWSHAGRKMEDSGNQNSLSSKDLGSWFYIFMSLAALDAEMTTWPPFCACFVARTLDLIMPTLREAVNRLICVWSTPSRPHHRL